MFVVQIDMVTRAKVVYNKQKRRTSMKLLFKQRVFSWLDSYDIYNEHGETLYTVEGKLAWGHKLVIYNHLHEAIGEVKEEVFSFLPKFKIYIQGEEVGLIEKEFSFLKPKFHLTCNDWIIQGNIMEWVYNVYSGERLIMHAEKQIFNFSDTYVMDISKDDDALLCLMIALAIDAAKCSRR